MNLTQVIDIKERIATGEHLTPPQRDFILQCINEATGLAPAVAHSPRNYLGRIEQIWAFLSVDDGGEGICAAPGSDGMMIPLIVADKRHVEQLRPTAERIVEVSRKSVRLAKFTKREDIEIIHP